MFTLSNPNQEITVYAKDYFNAKNYLALNNVAGVDAYQLAYATLQLIEYINKNEAVSETTEMLYDQVINVVLKNCKNSYIYEFYSGKSAWDKSWEDNDLDVVERTAEGWY